MAEPSKIIPVKCNLDLAAEYMDNLTARFIKNLTPYVGATNEYAGIKEGQNKQKLKPLQANELYVNIPVPAGDNYCVGIKGFSLTNEVYVFVWNSNGNHFIYRLNCGDRTFNIVKIDPNFNFKKEPKYFMGETQIALTVIPLVEPDTNREFIAKELKWTTGAKYQGYLRVDDSIATNGFDEILFPYFSGTYDKAAVVRMGLPTPKGCIKVTEVPRITDPLDPNYDLDIENKLLFQKWFFIIKYIDVWGRPSEWGARSIEYTPGINDCIASSNNIPRCLDLEFEAGSPFINNIEIGFLNCSQGEATIWHKEETLFLYTGSNIGEWWKRPRNPNITYNATTNKITYRFCRSKECEIIPADETARLENPLPQSSQALINLNGNMALFNNRSKFNPFPQSLKEKITFKVTPPAAQSNLGTRQITIYVPIWNPTLNNWQSVTKDGNNGYIWGDNNSKHNGARAYAQYFTNIDQSGFTGYLVGGGSVTSTQVYVDANGLLVDDPTHIGNGLSPIALTFQKFVFNNVAPGKYPFRLASHLSDPNSDPNYRGTSTTVWGKCPFTHAGFLINPSLRQNNQELIIDVCNGDYDTLNQSEMLVIVDTAAFVSGQTTNAKCGYCYTTNKNGFNENPVELLSVTCVHGDYISNITDHNGFYYYGTRGSGRVFSINVLDTCVSRQINDNQSGTTGMEFKNVIIDTYFTLTDYSTALCNQILIKGKLLLQGTNIGISNATVVLTRGQSAITDDNGDFTIIAHDDVGLGTRNDTIIIGAGGCGYTGENGICVPSIDIVIQRCTTCAVRTQDVGTTILQYVVQKGLLDGGTYPVGCVGWDWLGRATYVQPLGYINIPSINQSKAIAPSLVEAFIDPTATFPPEIQYITFFVGAETTIEKYLTWIIDDFKFIDSQGLANTSAPTQIKIYYNSIIQYSKVHNFNTTTAWDFIPVGKETPALSDKILFFLNGDGQFFPKAISGLVKYDQVGEFFTIDYTSDLKDLKKNALIRLVRHKNCTGNEPYYEICNSKVEIVNGKAQIQSFILDAFDTYYLPRQIPVPVPQTSPTTDTITTTITNGNTSVATQQTPIATPTVLELRTFGFKFPHFAPSNFWGDGCSHVGRLNVKNPYEAELIQWYQVAISGGLSINGQLNYLCYFDDRKTTTFEMPTAGGGIMAAYAEVGKLLLIEQTSHFLVGYNDNLGRVNANGTFQAPSTPNEFGKPQRKEGDTYGCNIADKMAIQATNGKVMWVDRSQAEIVQHDFQQIKSFTKDKCDGWFKAKCKAVLADPNQYFTGGINPTGEYMVTNQTILNTTYINSERTYNALVPETVSFDIETRDLKTWFSFLTEQFAYLDGDILNLQMFTFKNGLPYSHYNGTVNNIYNTFFGVECEKVLTIVYQEDPFAKKMFLAITLYCEQQKFFSDKIITEAKQESRILLTHWNKAAYFSIGVYLCNLNSVPDPNLVRETGINVLMDGDRLYGTWHQIRLIGDPKNNADYCEILGITIDAFKYEKS